MKFLLKISVFIIPMSFIFLFFILLTNEDSYPGADYDIYEIPQFELKDLDNIKTINTDLFSGDFVLNVWASWCITCVIEHPYLMRLNSKGIPVIGLNYKDEREDAVIWLNKYGNPYKKIGSDQDGRVSIDWGVYGVPETFVIDQHARIAYKHVGPLSAEDMKQKILPLLQELQAR